MEKSFLERIVNGNQRDRLRATERSIPFLAGFGRVPTPAARAAFRIGGVTAFKSQSFDPIAN